MAISVTTRSGKGSPLTTTEMDTNLTNLARTATTSVEGNTTLATNAETITGTSTTTATTPSGVAAAIADAAFSAAINGDATNGSVTIGELIVKWMKIASLSSGTTYTWTTAFPTECFGVILMCQANPASGDDRESMPTSINTAGFTSRNVTEYSGLAHFAIAIGN